jgi:hypothetical protein
MQQEAACRAPGAWLAGAVRAVDPRTGRRRLPLHSGTWRPATCLVLAEFCRAAGRLAWSKMSGCRWGSRIRALAVAA